MTGPGTCWLKQTKDFTVLVGGILRIIQLDLYQLGCQALQNLSENPDLTENPIELLCALQSWYSPFSALTVISNHLMPFHWDLQGQPEWFDMLISLGEYLHGRLSLPGLSLVLRYNPGTIDELAQALLPTTSYFAISSILVGYFKLPISQRFIRLSLHKATIGT